MLTSFTLTSSIAIIVMLLIYNSRVSKQFLEEVKTEQEIIVRQISAEVSSYLKNIMRISDTLSYSVILGQEFDKIQFAKNFQLIYDSNKNTIKNIALFDDNGDFLVGSPAVTIRQDVNVLEEQWFFEANRKKENIYFSKPHVQRLFYDSDNNYDWVISVSRSLPISINGKDVDCVLLLDINYSSLEQLFKNVSLRENSYIFLTDNNNEIIYHPKLQLIKSGYFFEDIYDLQNSIVTKNTVGYTGWNIVSVSSKNLSINSIKNNLFFLAMLMLYILIILIVNYIISKKVSNPIVELTTMVKEIEEGNLEVKSNINGFYEVEHLGHSIEEMALRISKLMEEIEKEHELKMISEFETLQSQINPHFLYNTLEVIVWFIENEKPKEASKSVVALAKFFRISLSKGKSIISVENEIEHVKNYLMIQSLRYKNRFEFNVKMAEDTKNLSTIKLILQPIVENAIYHGLEYLDEGEINIESFIENSELHFVVEDNGLGMTADVLEKIKTGKVSNQKRGSGIGIKNIDERIKIYFGQQYGLTLISELDVGTKVIINLPLMEYKEEL